MQLFLHSHDGVHEQLCVVLFYSKTVVLHSVAPRYPCENGKSSFKRRKQRNQRNLGIILNTNTQHTHSLRQEAHTRKQVNK
jgi:N-acetyl-anhydromuramyl-L-alanine amidase AmpD